MPGGQCSRMSADVCRLAKFAGGEVTFERGCGWAGFGSAGLLKPGEVFATLIEPKRRGVDEEDADEN